jgi:hypothetical protein
MIVSMCTHKYVRDYDVVRVRVGVRVRVRVRVDVVLCTGVCSYTCACVPGSVVPREEMILLAFLSAHDIAKICTVCCASIGALC